MVIERMLAKQNCKVSVAKDGTQALALLKEQGYKLILLDIGLPDMTGFDIARSIRADEGNQNQFIPIVAVTAHVDSSRKVEAYQVGMNAILSKAVPQARLEDLLQIFVL